MAKAFSKCHIIKKLLGQDVDKVIFVREVLISTFFMNGQS